MWIKYRAKWSHGFSAWEYSFMGKMSFEDCVEIKKEDAENEWGWSEHYRGVEIEKVDSPPVEVVKAKIEETKGYIKSHEKHLAELMKYINEPA